MTGVVTRRVDGPVDLFDVAGDDGWVLTRDGVGVAGRGTFARVDAAHITGVLAGLGDRVCAIGARPFDPSAPWDLVIPAHQVRIDPDGTVTETHLGDPRAPVTDPIRADTTDVDTGDVRIRPVEDPADWMRRVVEATDLIRAGAADKIVLARAVDAIGAAPFAPRRIAERLAGRFAGCYIFRVDGLVGASPELLVERTGSTVRSQPMAGSAQRDADPDRDDALQAELFASPTYRHEHQLTIDMVHDTLLDYTSYLDFEPEPSIVALANVAHLATRVEGELSDPPASVLELQQALHPTPAVSGRPRDAAVAAIRRLESTERDRYAGTIGWVDGAGNGTWAVTIRCAQIDPHDPRRVRVHAGCGLVADSEPERELAESEAKLQALLGVLAP